jgi:integrase
MRLKYVSATRKQNADGWTTTYYFYRRPGSRAIALGSDPARVEERWRILQMQFAAADRVNVRAAGTIADLIAQYYASLEFKKLSDRTKELWRAGFRDLENKFGDFPPDAIPVVIVQKWKEKLIEKHGKHGARNRLVAFRRLYGWARKLGLTGDTNPFAKLGSFGEEIEQDDPPIWRIDDVHKFLSAKRRVQKGGNPNLSNSNLTEERELPPNLRLAFLLGLFTMQRLGDVLSLTGRHLSKDESGRFWIKLRQRKTKRKIEFPAHKILAGELVRQKISPGDDRFLVRSSNGLPFDRSTFYKRFVKWTEATGLRRLKFKDLRSSGMVTLVQAGVPTPQIVSVSGHSIHEAQRILDRYLIKTKEAAAAAIDRFEVSLPSLYARPPAQASSGRGRSSTRARDPRSKARQKRS